MTQPKKEDSDKPPQSPISHFFARIVSPGNWPDAWAQLTFWGLFLGGLALDLWSKKAIFDTLAYPDSITVIDGFLRFVPAVNNGAAFGICAGQPLFLTATSFVALVVVTGYFFLCAKSPKLVQVALGLLAAGICGNLYDRIFNEGLVRDFIDVYITAFGAERHWHTFNVADALLCIGVGLLIIWTGFTATPVQKHAQQPK